MRKVVVFTGTNPSILKAHKELNNYFDFTRTSVELVHFLVRHEYAYQDGLYVPYYPNKEQIKDLQETLGHKLKMQMDLFKGIAKENFKANIQVSQSPKRDAVKYLAEVRANVAVCITPKKSTLGDLFHSSFTDYLSAHADSDLIMIRQH